MRFVSVPRLDALKHKALLPKFPPPLGADYMDSQLACQQHLGPKSVTRKLVFAFTSTALCRQLVVDVSSFEVISYLKLSGSRQSRRPSAVSACGYMRKPTGVPVDPGSATSCAKL